MHERSAANPAGSDANELLALCEGLVHDLAEPLRVLGSRQSGSELAMDAERTIRDILHDVLGYARAVASSRTPEPTDCSVLFDRVRSKLSVQLEELGAEITRGALPVVMGDPDQLEQVFMRLVEHAIDQRSTAALRVHAASEPDGAGFKLTVRDNGLGLGGPHLGPPVFDQLHSHTGHGLGLALCKRVVEHHGGTIWLESAPNAGTTVHFTLA